MAVRWLRRTSATVMRRQGQRPIGGPIKARVSSRGRRPRSPTPT